MAIPFTRYVAITSAVGAGEAFRRRDLIARLFTTNGELPTLTVQEFDTADAVGRYFGTDTEEFRRARFYFGFTSKLTTRPGMISFARWANADTAASVLGSNHQALDQLQTITAGTFQVEFGGTSHTLDSLNFSGDNSFSDVASAIQNELRTGSGAVFTQATVTYNTTRSRFEITAGATGANTVTVTAGSTNDAAGPLGLLEANGARLSYGVATQSITDLLSASTERSNNFGSFGFMSMPQLSQPQKVEAATWNNGQNVLFQFHTSSLPTETQALSAAVIALAGTGITLNRPTLTDQYPEMLPMAVLAATDYTRRNSTQNFMFQVDDRLTATVTTSVDADLYDGQRVNYYGQTQTAGQLRQFYQRGVLTGGIDDPVDMNTYANEQWLKDDAGVRIMNLLVALPKVSANQRGRGQLLAAVQETINQALLNGTISVGRALTGTQRTFITLQTGNELAHHQVSTSGYWVDAQIQSFQTSDNRTEFRARYTLIYLKDDVIRMVQGTHTLI